MWYEEGILLSNVILGRNKTYMSKIVDSSMWYRDGSHLFDIYDWYMWYCTDKTYMYNIIDSSMWYEDVSDIYHW